MIVETGDPSAFPNWNEMIAATDSYSFFHSVEWADVLQSSYGYQPTYFFSFEEGKPLACIPMMAVCSRITGKRGVSMPFSDYCDPLITGKNQFNVFFKRIVATARSLGWKYIEIRGGQDCLSDAPVFRLSYLHHVKLGDHRLLFKNLRESTKRNIRKAEKEGVVIEQSNSLEAVKAFYRLNCRTRKEHGIPPQPFLFFERLHEKVIAQDKGLVLLARYGNRTVAGAICLHIGKRAIYKYGASDRLFRFLRPNNGVIWEALKWYSDNGFEDFSLGITEPQHQGLMQFKRGWGAQEKSICYYRYIVDKQAFQEGQRYANSLWNNIAKKIPGPFLNALGFIFYRHVG